MSTPNSNAFVEMVMMSSPLPAEVRAEVLQDIKEKLKPPKQKSRKQKKPEDDSDDVGEAADADLNVNID